MGTRINNVTDQFVEPEPKDRVPRITTVKVGRKAVEIFISVGPQQKVVSASTESERAKLAKVFTDEIVQVLLADRPVPRRDLKKTLQVIETQLNASKREAIKNSRTRTAKVSDVDEPA